MMSVKNNTKSGSGSRGDGANDGGGEENPSIWWRKWELIEAATGRSTSSIIVLHRPSVVSCDILFIFGYDLLQIYMHIIGCASVYPCSLQGPSLGDMSSKSKLASYQELGCMCVCIFLVQ
ncbi:hypothetical protein ZEAMMB73_Zm00001d034772 [Zea mays]|uniref:Uncharacterized protein n=1 Tax=Zea mays TaxID=4577 RepID=A0A1D6LB47_MAIZE|nr:hypothetical protein ZEAMMB73_Zm00001d034772 [Zea mays]